MARMPIEHHSGERKGIMNKVLTFLILSFILSVSSKADSKIKVVTTLTDLKSITEEIGGDKVEAFAIATGFQNPHFVDPKPSYILKLSKADMFVTVGLDLETGWVQIGRASCRERV